MTTMALAVDHRVQKSQRSVPKRSRDLTRAVRQRSALSVVIHTTCDALRDHLSLRIDSETAAKKNRREFSPGGVHFEFKMLL